MNLDPLRRPTFRRMVAAQFCAELGDGITMVVLPLYVWERTESEVWTSLTLGAELGFGVTTRAVGMADNPSFDALVPDQAKDDLQEVLAIRRIVQAASLTLGPGIGALAVSQIGARPALLLNAAPFAISLIVLGGIPSLDREYAALRARRAGQSVGEAVSDLATGMAVTIRTPGVRRLLLHMCLVMATPVVVAISWFIWGVLLGPETVVSETFFVGRVPEDERGRAFAGLGVAGALGMAAGSFAAAPLLAAYSARWVILGTGAAVLVGGAIWIGPALEGRSWPDTPKQTGVPETSLKL